MGWPKEFTNHYAEKFWNHYQASGWKLSSGNSVKDWQACFNSQWKVLKYKEDIELLARLTGKVAPKINGNVTDFERLDRFMADYFARPTSIKFEDFGKWYEFMKEQRLLKPFTRGEVEELKTIYGDNGKCRCACVQKSLDQYFKTGFRIVDVLKVRSI